MRHTRLGHQALRIVPSSVAATGDPDRGIALTLAGAGKEGDEDISVGQEDEGRSMTLTEPLVVGRQQEFAYGHHGIQGLSRSSGYQGKMAVDEAVPWARHVDRRYSWRSSSGVVAARQKTPSSLPRIGSRVLIQAVGQATLSRCRTLASIATCAFSATISRIVGRFIPASRSIFAIASNGTVPVPICA